MIEKRQAEKELDESESCYRILFNSINDLVIVLHITSESLSGKQFEVNDVAFQKLGYTKKEFSEFKNLYNMLKL